MNEAEAKQFVKDLETGAFVAGTIEQHKIALDIQNTINGYGRVFPDTWESWNNERG